MLASKRAFALAVVATWTAWASYAQNLPLPPLPYEYNALEPFIDEQTMRIHHLKHHQGYTNKLNAALAELRADAETKHLAKLGIDKLLHSLDKVPAGLRGTIRNNGGGYVNHDIFWKSMRKPANQEEENKPSAGSMVEKQLETSFQSFELWKQSFSQSAIGVFGSGWAWLVFDGSKLQIETTPNQDTPNHPIILGLDVWEHAYYLKYQNNRVDYVENWFKLINWDAAEARFKSILKSAERDEL